MFNFVHGQLKISSLIVPHDRPAASKPQVKVMDICNSINIVCTSALVQIIVLALTTPGCCCHHKQFPNLANLVTIWTIITYSSKQPLHIAPNNSKALVWLHCLPYCNLLAISPLKYSGCTLQTSDHSSYNVDIKPPLFFALINERLNMRSL